MEQAALCRPAGSRTTIFQTLSITSDEWITTRTGIRERPILTTESVTEIAVAAARNALENSGISPADLGYIVCPTLGGDYMTPSLACVVQMELQANCPAVDVNGACSGILYALDVADGIFARGKGALCACPCGGTAQPDS